MRINIQILITGFVTHFQVTLNMTYLPYNVI